jgi:hypothetical protein
MKNPQYPTPQSLEYAAILSGLSMAGDTISDRDIKSARKSHIKNRKKRINLALPANDSTRWGLQNR